MVAVGEPPVPLTAMVKDPVGVEVAVEIVKMLLKLGLPEGGLKAQDAPVGSPAVQARLTD